jgi:5,10-methenyltetrahydrofolate synthetase
MQEPDGLTWPEVAVWRKVERERLIGLRLDMPAQTRSEFAGRMAPLLDQVVGDVEGRMISFYWPYRGEPDLRPWAARVVANGGMTALPVIVARGQPLIFRVWKLGDPLMHGMWDIPAPAGGEEVSPDIVIAPLVGWDSALYRLGHGAGFFDRTLAAMSAKPLVIGIGYSATQLPTIHPQAHDIPMQAIVTEKGILARAAA